MFTYIYCACLHIITPVYPCLPMFTRVCLPVFTNFDLCLPLFTRVYLCLAMFTRAC